MAAPAPNKKKPPRAHLEIPGFRKYDRIRQYLSLIYLYGCFNGKALAQINNRSVQDYNAVIAAIWDLIWPDADKGTGKQYKNKKSFPHVSRHYAISAQNRMADSYMMFPFDKKERLVLYLRILQRLKTSDANTAQLDEDLAQLEAAGLAYYLKTFYHVRNMADYGNIQRPSNVFTLPHNPLHDLEDWQLWELYHYVCFAANVTYPRVPGSFLRRTVERELLCRSMKIPEGSPFVLRHNSNHNVFDEEVVFRLLHIIEKKQVILINGHEYLPVKLRVDCRLGRWYVLMANEYNGKMEASIWAVFRMKLPTPYGEGNDPRWEQARSVVEEAYPVGESLFSHKSRRQAEPILVEAKLHFGAERGRRNQFGRELRIGQIECRSDGEYYCARINDPLELLPLLRAYSPWLEILPGNHNLDSHLREGLQQMQANLDGAVWESPGENGRSFEKMISDALDEEKESKKSKDENDDQQERKLLTPFQSRSMQFCLDVLAYASSNTAKREKEAQKEKTLQQKTAARQEEAEERKEMLAWLSRRYGIAVPQDIITVLRDGNFLAPGEELRLPERNRNFPELPMSVVEQDYLQYILDPQYIPEVSLFISEETRKKLQKGTNGNVTGEEAPIRQKKHIQWEKPVQWAKHIQWAKAPGISLPNNPGPEGFRLLLQAIQNRSLIRYTYRVKGEADEKQGECLPWKLEYSAYDRRWWVIFYSPKTEKEEPRMIKALLNHIRQIEVLEKTHDITEEKILDAMDRLQEDDVVDLRVRNQHNALQRCYTSFENYQIKSSSYSPEEGYKLSFYTYKFDKEEILRQLMYLGPNVSLDGPSALQEELCVRLQNAQKLNARTEVSAGQ